jgi:hypothetical protein
MSKERARMKRTLPVILVLSTVLSAGALPQAGSHDET